MNLIMLDDDLVVRTVMTKLLVRAGFKIDTCCNGIEVIDLYNKALFDEKPYDVVILDLSIPDAMGGQETMRELLKIDPNAIGIISSGYENNEVINNYSDYGFKAYLPKPYRVADLMKLLKTILPVQKFASA